MLRPQASGRTASFFAKEFQRLEVSTHMMSSGSMYVMVSAGDLQMYDLRLDQLYHASSDGAKWRQQHGSERHSTLSAHRLMSFVPWGQPSISAWAQQYFNGVAARGPASPKAGGGVQRPAVFRVPLTGSFIIMRL